MTKDSIQLKIQMYYILLKTKRKVVGMQIKNGGPLNTAEITPTAYTQAYREGYVSALEYALKELENEFELLNLDEPYSNFINR